MLVPVACMDAFVQGVYPSESFWRSVSCGFSMPERPSIDRDRRSLHVEGEAPCVQR